MKTDMKVLRELNKVREMQQSLATYKETVQKIELEKRVLQAQMAEYMQNKDRDSFRVRAYLHLKEVGVMVMDKEGVKNLQGVDLDAYCHNKVAAVPEGFSFREMALKEASQAIRDEIDKAIINEAPITYKTAGRYK